MGEHCEGGNECWVGCSREGAVRTMIRVIFVIRRIGGVRALREAPARVGYQVVDFGCLRVVDIRREG